jgi:KDO2-lipid IV(A) lauroyltransferase
MDRKKYGMVKKAAHIFEAIAVIILGNIFLRVPRRFMDPLEVMVGSLLLYLDGRDRRRAYRNLDIVFRDQPRSQPEKDRIVKALFKNVTSVALAYPRLYGLEAQSLPNFLYAENHQAVDEALREKKGVLLMTAHFGNWEYLGVLGTRLGYKVGVALKRQHNPHTDRIIRKIREEKGGVKCFFHGRDINHRIALHLKRNGVLALLADQRDISSSLITPFFGVPCKTADGPAKLHLWYGSPIVFGFSIKEPDGRYLLRFEGPYHFEDSGDYRADCMKIMTFINGKYEKLIKQYPGQWFSLLTPRWGYNTAQTLRVSKHKTTDAP